VAGEVLMLVAVKKIKEIMSERIFSVNFILGLVLVFAFVLAGGAEASISIIPRVSYFSPREQAFQDIYGGGPDYSLEISIPLWRQLDFWAAIGYFFRRGNLTITQEETTLKLVRYVYGLRYEIIAKKRWALNLGASLNYVLFTELNPLGDIRTGNMGYALRLEGLLFPAKHLPLSLLIEFASCKFEPAEFKFDSGGINLGLGFGYKF